ncbi:MAG: VCBS repeat-containing protein, partial [Candidatus Latescibacterota bacterium]|nr:VCBS repeat-containing protein [Candidatus Latescibacterota bacterium]
MSRILWCLAAGACLSSAAAAQLLAPPETSRASQRMAAYLARVAQRADPVVNIYLNRSRAEGMRTLLAQPMSPVKKIQLRAAIARELIKGGLMREAIDEIGAVRRQMETSGIQPEPGFLRMLNDEEALAHLRVGEQISRRRPVHGWLFPMTGTAESPFAEGARTAISLYTTNLEREVDLGTLWLLNLAYMTVGEYPHGIPEKWRLALEAFDSEQDVGFFHDVAQPSGVAVTGHAGGSVMDDFDGDGLLDLIASSRGLRDQMRYFHNRGDGTFADRTRIAGLEGQIGGLNLSHADYDNDGDRDLIVWRGAWMGEAGRHANSLLQNTGRGRFEDVTEAAGLLSFHPTHSGAWADFDNDGWLDLFVGNESSPAPNPPHPNQLYRSDRNGTFTDIASTAGVDGVGFAKGVTVGDVDNDGLVDIYVSNLNGDNLL